MNLIESLADQSVLPVRVIILVWKERSVIELHEFATLVHERIDPLWIELIIQHAFYSDHEQGHGVWYDRRFLVNQAKSEYSCMIDQDNFLPPKQLDAWIESYQEVVRQLGHEAIVSPTIMRAWEIQSQGITDFSYYFPRYTFGRCTDTPWQEVKMVWANSLFGRTDVFQRIQFDPIFAWSYEDIDFSSRVVQAGYSVVVLRDVSIDHQEPQKSFLWELFLGTKKSAYLRSRNRILRVRKTATWWQKTQYFGCGLWIQTAWWIRYIYRSGIRQKNMLVFAVIRWIRSGLWYRM